MAKLEWTKISRGRRLARHPDNFFVIVPEDAGTVVPFACPVCEIPMRTADDALSFREYECCESCKLKWAESRREKWKSGWRPTTDEIDEFRQIRLSLVPRVRV